jgi:hypothetical protein
MTEDQEREGDGQRGLKGKSRATFTPQKKTSSIIVCLLGVCCIASLAEQTNYSYILFVTIFNLG